MFIQAAEAKETVPHIATLKSAIYAEYLPRGMGISGCGRLVAAWRLQWFYCTYVEGETNASPPFDRGGVPGSLGRSASDREVVPKAPGHHLDLFSLFLCLFLFVWELWSLSTVVYKLSLSANSCKEYMPIRFFPVKSTQDPSGSIMSIIGCRHFQISHGSLPS